MTTFAEALAEKCVQAHKAESGEEFFHLRDRAGVAVFSVSPRMVHCPPGMAMGHVRGAVVGLIEEGIEEGRRQACTPSPEALAAAREEGRRAGWAEALAVATRQAEWCRRGETRLLEEAAQATRHREALEAICDAIRREAP